MPRKGAGRGRSTTYSSSRPYSTVCCLLPTSTTASSSAAQAVPSPFITSGQLSISFAGVSNPTVNFSSGSAPTSPLQLSNLLVEEFIHVLRILVHQERSSSSTSAPTTFSTSLVSPTGNIVSPLASVLCQHHGRLPSPYSSSVPSPILSVPPIYLSPPPPITIAGMATGSQGQFCCMP